MTDTPILPIFFQNMETSQYRNVSTFLDFTDVLKVWKRLYVETCSHFLILSIFQYFIIVSIPHRRTVLNTRDDSCSDSGHFFENNGNVSI